MLAKPHTALPSVSRVGRMAIFFTDGRLLAGGTSRRSRRNNNTSPYRDRHAPARGEPENQAGGEVVRWWGGGLPGLFHRPPDLPLAPSPSHYPTTSPPHHLTFPAPSRSCTSSAGR